MAPKIDIVDYLRALKGHDIHYYPNPGNAGDSAIALGTYDLFKQARLSPAIVTQDEAFDPTGRTVIYGGGGNLAASYSEASEFIERHHRRAKKLIVLPHTVQGNADLLAELGSNVDVICREQRSAEWVLQQTTRANVYLSDDLAFHINARQVVTQSEVSPGVLARWIVQRPIQGALERAVPGFEGERRVALRPALEEGQRALFRLLRAGSRKQLFAFRTDREQVETPPPPGNVDVTRIFSYGTAPRSTARQATAATLAYLDQFEQIATNRLHVCILAALLGKRVDFYANSYFKNEAVYEFSLKDRYPRVRWCGHWQGV